jgi:ferritin-like metal-binding protein YciE
MEMKALEDLLLQELMELYSAEQQILKAFPKLINVAQNAALRAAFELHSKQTTVHGARLDKIFSLLHKDVESVDCDPIASIIKQTDRLTAVNKSDPAVLDAALISAAQKVEHYEIALYGAARSHSRLLGYLKIAEILSQTLREEEETDALLTRLAEKRVNVIAAKAPFANARSGQRGSNSRGWGVGALVSCLAIGAAVALVYAPESGEQMRGELKAKADALMNRAGNREQRTMEDEGYTPHTS